MTDTAVLASPLDSASAPAEAARPEREISFEHSRDFAGLLEQLRLSLLVSTYQAGKLAVVGARRGQLSLAFHNFERVMGVAASSERLAVGTQREIWFMQAAPDIAPRIDPPGTHDGCYLARSAHYTGEIHVHDLAFAGEELWCANTLFSCLCTIDGKHSFVPRWRPPFISALAAEDRCHLNGFCLEDGKPAYATVIAQTDTRHGWRPNKASSGALLKVPQGEAVLTGLSMPHSPRLHQGKLWVLDSGTGRLLRVDTARGRGDGVAELPGYTRGLALHGNYAFIGLSRIRESNIFGGLPIAARREELKCGVGVIELSSGRLVAHLEFKSGVEEIFAVEVLPAMCCPILSGPYAHVDGTATIWSAPALPD